jgi:hypothetical protein
MSSSGRPVITGGTSAGLPSNVRSVTADATAVVGDFVRVNATTGAKTVTLPAGSAGNLVIVAKVDSSANAVAVTVASSGTINGDAEGASLASENAIGLFECTSTGAWQIVSGFPSSAQSGSGLPANVLIKTANFTAAADDLLLCDATGGAFTITLPAAPATGACVTVKKTDASANAVNVNSSGGGSIDGDTGSPNLAITGGQLGAIFEHVGSNAWKIVSVTATGAQGPVGPTGAMGPTGATGATGPAGTNGILANFQDEGSAVTARDTLDLQGNGAALSQNGTKLILSVPGGDPRALPGATAATRFVGGTNSGAPTTGTFAIGDFVIARNGAIWICTTAGTPGTWTQVSGGGSASANPASLTAHRGWKGQAAGIDILQCTGFTGTIGGDGVQWTLIPIEVAGTIANIITYWASGGSGFATGRQYRPRWRPDRRCRRQGARRAVR